MNQSMSMRVKAQRFGGKLSAMILPNLGAFMGWGILTAINAFVPNPVLRTFVVPMLVYLLPLLIAISAGRMVYGEKGAVVAAFAMMGVILGADIPMLMGAMLMGPLSAWILKKTDGFVEPHIPIGFELLIGNLTVAFVGVVMSIIGYTALSPAITSVSGVFAIGVAFLQERSLLPLTAIFIEPGKVLFLNNAIGQGILTPLGTTQLADMGKSVLFLLESNPGPGLGILLAYCAFGKGNARANAYGATVIHFLGGIHEIYFPYILMKPMLVLAVIAGGVTGTFVFTIFNVGLVGVSSPGSVITIMMMAAAGDRIKILAGIFAAALVSFLIASVIVRHGRGEDDEENKKLREAARQMEELKGKKSRISSVFEEHLDEKPSHHDENSKKDGSDCIDYGAVETILYVCDAGLGSSAMGASVVLKKLKQAGIKDIAVPHARVAELPQQADIIITHKSLSQLAAEKQPGTPIISIEDYLGDAAYDRLVMQIVGARKGVK